MFVIQRWESLSNLGQMYYYTQQEADRDYKEFSENPKSAMVFDNLVFAARTASAVDGEIRVLTRKEELAEFRDDALDTVDS